MRFHQVRPEKKSPPCLFKAGNWVVGRAVSVMGYYSQNHEVLEKMGDYSQDH
jgi:hypothetical protein